MKCKRGLFQLMFLLFGLVFFSACGGGGSSSNQQGKVAITGVISFPVEADRVTAKSVALPVIDSDLTVEAYTLDGVKVASVKPTYDDSETQRIYSYSLPDLTPSVDYVIKAKRGSLILKKLIEAKDVAGTILEGQNINAVSTAAVVVASQNLSTDNVVVVLGDVLPTGKTVAGISLKISTDIKPVLLEATIDAAVNGGLANVTTSNVAYANVFNIVVTAATQNIDPSSMFTTAPPSLPGGVPIITVAAGSATVATTTVTAATITQSATPTYTAPTETAATYTGLAKQALAAQDISNASLYYEKALTIDANDKEANFGGAITSGLMLMEDADVKSIISKWGGVLPTVNQVIQGTSPIKFGNMTSFYLTGGSSSTNASMPKSTAKTVASTSSAQDVLAAFKALQGKLPQQKAGFKTLAKELALVPTTAPTVTEMQTVIDNVIIPKIDKILARLAKVEGVNYSFIVTKAMQGNPVNGSDATLNDGEFYTLDAALNVFQILFKLATAYNFDIPSPYNYNTIGQDPLAMIDNATVFSLKSGGAAKMAAALNNAKSAAAKTKLAYDIVVLRAAGAGVFDFADWTATEKSDFTSTLTDITASLQGAKIWIIGGKAVNIDATKFFTNPLTRASLPKFGYDVLRNEALSTQYGKPVAGERTFSDWIWNGTTYVQGMRTESISCNLVPKSDLPDYSLNGILPGNTATNNVVGFNGILPHLEGKLLSDPNANVWEGIVTTDGTDLYFLVNTGYSDNAYTYDIKKITLSTGVVTKTITVSTPIWAESLFWYNNNFYLMQYNGGFYQITVSGVAINPTFSVDSSNGSLAAITANGTDIYYALKTWNQMTMTSSTDVWKSANLSTPVRMFTTTDDIYSLYFRNGFLYTGSNEWLQKRAAASPGTVAANYMESGEIGVGGYFYSVYDGKLIKWAGTPAGGAAKVSAKLGSLF